MSTGSALALVALVLLVALSISVAFLRRRLHRIEARLHSIEAQLARLGPSVSAARDDARAAAATARRAAAAAGVEDPPPRVPLEPVTGPLVRAVAVGAGARRALRRLSRPRLRGGRG